LKFHYKFRVPLWPLRLCGENSVYYNLYHKKFRESLQNVIVSVETFEQQVCVYSTSYRIHRSFNGNKQMSDAIWIRGERI